MINKVKVKSTILTDKTTEDKFDYPVNLTKEYFQRTKQQDKVAKAKQKLLAAQVALL
jgi:hypothetical protein